ncbi:MAG: hypothetical protein R3A80_13720 [Bdellovibrionota bacterium]
MAKKYLKSFAAGFLATLIFHQGMVAFLHLLGVLPFAAYNLSPTQPLGVPAVISLAFFGGIWGILLLPLLQNKATFWIRAIVLGAVLPSFVAIAIVFPLKGIPFQAIIIPIALLLNACWGFGLGLFLKLSRA